MFVFSNAPSIRMVDLWYSNLTMLYIVPTQSSNITALAFLLEEHLKKRTFHVFIFILPTLTLGTILAHFLFKIKEIDCIYKILAQFQLGIIILLIHSGVNNVHKQGFSNKLTFCGKQLDGDFCWVLIPSNKSKVRWPQWHAVLWSQDCCDLRYVKT